MYAQIIPLVKMPRRFAFFDYKIPIKLKIKIGDLVLMPLKGRLVPGIVRALSENTEYKKLRSIETVLKPGLMTRADIERLELIAQQIAQSPSTVFTSALQGFTHAKSTVQNSPVINSGSIDKETVKTLLSALENEEVSIETSLEGCITIARLAIQKSKKQVLILCPRERDVEIFSRFITQPHARLHGHTPPAKRKWVIENWQSGEVQILLGTRQASLIPAKEIATVIIFDSHSDDHVNYSRNPRYDARLAAKLLAKQHNAKIVECGSLSKLSSLKKPSYASAVVSAKIIDLADKREKTGIPLISESLIESIADSLQKDKKVLISYNCKGVAKHLQCRSCHHIPMCGTCGAKPHVRLKDLVCPTCSSEMWIPEKCPSCGKKTLSTRGIGNKKIAENLRKRFPKIRIEIIDKEHSKNSEADIQIATEHFFQSIYKPFPKDRFGLIAELMAEKSLGDSYDSSIITAYRLNRILHMAHHHKSNCIIQTWMPDVIKPMTDSKSFLLGENELRAKYQLPPFTDQFELTGDINSISDEIQSNGIEQDGKLVLTSEKTNRKIIIKQLKELPDSVTILTRYTNYDT